MRGVSSYCPMLPTTLQSFHDRCGTLPRNQISLCDPRVEMEPLAPARMYLVRSPCGYEIPLGNQKLDGLNEIGKDRRILPQEFLDLIEELRASRPGVASQWRTTSGAMRPSNSSAWRLFHASKKRRIRALFCSIVVLIVRLPVAHLSQVHSGGRASDAMNAVLTRLGHYFTPAASC